MRSEIKIPNMGESISKATIHLILIQSGAKVVENDEILEIETDKVSQTIYAPQDGVLTLNVDVNETVQIGQTIGFIDTDVIQSINTGVPDMETKSNEAKPAAPSRIDKNTFLDSLLSDKDKEPDNKENVATENTNSFKPSKIDKPETRSKLSNIRKVISSRLLEVQNSTAMLTTFNEVDMTKVLMLRTKYNPAFQEQHNVKLSIMSFFVKAAVSALKEYPLVNSYIDGDDLVTRNYYDIGIAVGSDKGLMVPVLEACEELSFADIENNIKTFAKKINNGTIEVKDLQGGGFTITNGGIYGSMLSTPFLNPPQSAILGMHKIEKRPVVVNGEIVIRDIMYLALTYDHRVIDGREAVSFLTHIKKVIEDPSRLLLDVTF